MGVVERLARGRIFYGWYIVAVSFASLFMSVGLQGFTMAVFMKPMVEDLGWSRAGFTGVQSLGTVVAGVLALFIGGTLDRRGVRAFFVIGALCIAIAATPREAGTPSRAANVKRKDR